MTQLRQLHQKTCLDTNIYTSHKHKELYKDMFEYLHPKKKQNYLDNF